MKFVPLLLVLLLTGCGTQIRYVNVESKYPLIDAPQRPVVPTDPPLWTPREVILSKYALDLEAKVRAYNLAAQDHNIKNGY